MTIDIVWWITAFDLPALAGLFWLIWHTRREGTAALLRLNEILETRHSQMREGLSAFKLEVAKGYASRADLHDLEDRLVGHLLRIEAKLDATALKAERISESRNH